MKLAQSSPVGCAGQWTRKQRFGQRYGGFQPITDVERSLRVVNAARLNELGLLGSS